MGGGLNVDCKNTKARYVKFSLCDKNYLHLKKIEIFEDVSFFLKSRGVSSFVYRLIQFLKNIEPDCYLYYYKSNLYINNSLTCSYLSYIINLSNPNYFSIRLDVSKILRSEVIYFLVNLSTKFNLRTEFQNSILTFYLIDDKNMFDFVENQSRIYQFLSALNYYAKISYSSFFLNNAFVLPKKHLIIDSDLSVRVGFADRIRGILSLIEMCNKMNIEYSIKFTKPFNLNRYYSFMEVVEQNFMISRCSYVLDYASIIKYKYMRPFYEDTLINLISSALNTYQVISVGTNIIGTKFNRTTFVDNFKMTDYLSEHVSKFKKNLGNYISISFRFINALGNFEKNPFSKPLSLSLQEKLILSCKNEIINFLKNIDNQYKCLILSDSSKFLESINDIDRVYTFPENIAHIAFVNSNDSSAEMAFLKTIIDFNLIMDANEIYRFDCEYLYPTNFPAQAAFIAGKQLKIHKFQVTDR